MGQRNGTLAMPRTRCHHLGQRPEHAAAAVACLEKRQHLSVARGFHRRRAALAGRSGAEPEVTLRFLWRATPDERGSILYQFSARALLLSHRLFQLFASVWRLPSDN